MHNATAITTGSANQRPNTPCIRMWIEFYILFRKFPEKKLCGRKIGKLILLFLKKNVKKMSLMNILWEIMK